MDKRKTICFLVAIGIALFLCAGSSTIYGREGNVIRVACFERDGRWEQGAQSSWDGYDVKLLEKIANYTGWHYEFVHVTGPKEAKLALDSGEADIVTSMPYVNEDAEKYLYSNLHGGYSYGGFIVKKESEDISFENLQSFSGRRIGYVKEGSNEDQYEEILKKTYPEENLWEYGNFEELRSALWDGQIDIMVASIEDMDMSKEKLLHKFCPDQLYFMAAADSDYIMEELDEALAMITVEEPAYLNELQKKYFPMFSSNELSKDEEDYLKAFGTIRVGVPADRYPISMYDEKNGMCVGMIEDYLEVLENKIDITIETVPVSEFGKANVDVYLPVTKEEAKYHDQIKEVSDSFMESALYAFVRADVELKVGETWKIGLTKEISDKVEIITDMYPNVEIQLYDDISSCLDGVNAGEIDGMVHNIYVLNYQQRYSGQYRLRVSSMIHIPVDYCFGGTREKSKLIRILNKGMRQVESGDVDQILAKYVTNPSEPDLNAMVYENRHIIFAACSIVIVLFTSTLLFVRQREAYFKEIKAANQELLKASQAKTDFLSKMSHEIRTPMNAIIGMARLAKSEKEISGGVRNYLNKIGVSSEYLLSILNDILDMSVIESGKLELHPSWEDPKSVVKICIEMLEPLMKEKGIHFLHPDFEKQAYQYECYVDKMRARQILMNLLNNALKFTPEGGTIELSMQNLRLEEDSAVDLIIVRDTGCGISKENQKKVFEPFEQGDNAYKSNIQGTGLGLTVVSQIVQAMGGSITLESIPSEGTTFFVEFPYIYRKKQVQAEFMDSDSITCLEGLRVLLVEDNQINTEVAQKILEKKGMIVYNASNGKEAVEMLEISEESYYGVVLMDVRMPVMDGIAAAMAIRELDRGDAHNIPIIAMTADAFEEDIQRTKKAGMDEHLSKPIQPDELYKIIQKVVKK